MGDTLFALAYLIEPPDVPKYKPFKSVEQAMEAIQKHGGWVKYKKCFFKFLITGFDGYGCILGNAEHYNITALFSDFVFADDGSPCGELAEE